LFYNVDIFLFYNVDIFLLYNVDIFLFLLNTFFTLILFLIITALILFLIITALTKYDCDFEDGNTCTWRQTTDSRNGDNFNWDINQGPTSSSSTGPNNDHTLGMLKR
jgi:hypothetical protein